MKECWIFVMALSESVEMIMGFLSFVVLRDVFSYYLFIICVY
jgi:hypothetical protein